MFKVVSIDTEPVRPMTSNEITLRTAMKLGNQVSILKKGSPKWGSNITLTEDKINKILDDIKNIRSFMIHVIISEGRTVVNGKKLIIRDG